MNERNTFENLANKCVSEHVSVAKNPNTPTLMLEKLSEDNDWLIRIFVAANPNTPISTLEKLCNDVCVGVVYEARKNIKSRITESP